MRSIDNRLLVASGHKIEAGLQACLRADDDVGDANTVTRLILLADVLFACRDALLAEARACVPGADLALKQQALLAEVNKFSAEASEYAAICAEMVRLDSLGFTACGSRIVPLAGSYH